MDAIADMRAAARWTIGALAAVGSLVLGGIPVAILDRVHDRGDLVAASLGMLVALLGVSWAVWHTSEALTPPVSTLSMLNTAKFDVLRRQLEADPEAFFGGFGADVSSLRSALEFHDRVRDCITRMLAVEQPGENERLLRIALEDAHCNIARARSAQRLLLAFIHTWQVRNAFRRARWHTFAGVLISALGVVTLLTTVLR